MDTTKRESPATPGSETPRVAAAGRPTLWTGPSRRATSPPLRENLTTDVCVVGAGMTGLNIAYRCLRSGLSVVVLDDGPVGGGQTCRSTAHLTVVFDRGFDGIERLHGEAGLRQAVASHTRAIDEIERIATEEEIACDFARVDGFLCLSPGESVEALDRDLDAAERAGVAGIERLPRAPIASWDTGPCNRVPRQAQFHPVKYVDGLVHAIERRGGAVYSEAHVADWSASEPLSVTTVRGDVVTARSVVFATNSPVNHRFAIQTKQAAYLSHVIGLTSPDGAFPDALLWEMGWPYHYLRRARGAEIAGDVLLVGGQDYKSGQGGAHGPAEAYLSLEAWARERFPSVGAVIHRWSGQVLMPVDGLAFIGRDPGGPPNVYVATGGAGQGLTHGTIAGLLISDLIVGRPNPWEALYAPTRRTAAAVLDFARENLNAVGQLVDHLTSGDVASRDDIPCNGGAIVRSGLAKHAVFRDAAGGLHEMSAVCPHLGGLVRWNDAEKTWDCPCHGARFDPIGTVICGPANTDLPPRDA